MSCCMIIITLSTMLLITTGASDVHLNNVEIDPDVSPDIREDAKLTTLELVRKYGYPAESHTITNDDGYILELHRIPGSTKSPPAADKQPVLLMHGILSSSADWVNMGPNHSFAYLLADAGYDVWMPNVRGNRYSRKHVTLKSDDSEFWNFSWHEIGVVDLPNSIDYVLSVTDYKQLHYIGHSQGTTAFWVMASMRPQYNAKIITMQALAPIAFMSNVRSPFVRATMPFLNAIELGLNLFGVNEFMPSNEAMRMGGASLCKNKAVTQIICTNALFLIAGYNSDQFNTSMLPVIMGHSPAGSSTKQVFHYGQGIRSGQFRQYDHGAITNLIKYGSISPPNYNLSKITAPVALHYSDNDWLAHPTDVDELNRNLGNVIGMFRVPMSSFNHIDYTLAIDVKELLYNRVMKIMRSYE